jgi:hypothetical protein
MQPKVKVTLVQGEIFNVTIGRAAWEACSATWNLGTNSAFAEVKVFLIEIFFRLLQVCYFVAPSLTRGRVCNLLQLQLIYDRQSVGQSVLVSGAHLGPVINFSFSLKFLLDSYGFNGNRSLRSNNVLLVTME